MRFLVDECAGPALAAWLRAHGHAVFSVYEEARGLTDDVVLAKAFAERWIVVTNDKGFGERIQRRQRPHCGVVLLRLRNERANVKIETMRRLLAEHADKLEGRYVVVTEHRVRFAPR